ncbi:DUF871 domain-containing protein [Pelosinus baikalensis]|uniref:MupG family TIM beta-alpha barrel fold protein n=1 Tax=Pelosinus baikalensis TaxID=2892015 RepID=A0ABS8HYK3_9FIRM|nr:MupG family TIM beta-alpha barrel fold protein [Pelosinus baikalensis]MCC5468241.1 MupG family TIM beta-alpha barrel fold protein [Pelosinus baikalensis]
MAIEKGISVYVGMGHKEEAIREYMFSAHQYGYSRIFTSLHIPEADSQKILNEFTNMVKYAKQLGFCITADISPASFELLRITRGNIDDLCKLGIDTLRLDFGFNLQETAELAKKSQFDIELNASTIDQKILNTILGEGIDPARLRACHNYYPRPETGLSYGLFAERSQLFRSYGIPVVAFIASHNNPRGPIYEGVPSLEQHRYMNPVTAAKHFFASKLVDAVIFGDPFAATEELAGVAALDERYIELAVDTKPGISDMERAILLGRHTNRNDPGEHVIRSQEARNSCRDTILKRSALTRPCGAVTIDNVEYLRYMGELQVVCRELPIDARTNVVAQVIKEELFLLEYIQPGRSFCFKEK